MEFPNRKPNRLKNYDYSQTGMYFITICANNRKCVFGEIAIEDGCAISKLTYIGDILAHYIDLLTYRYPSVRIDQYVIMPNHIHIIVILDSIENGTLSTPTLGTIVGWYKYQTTKHINEINSTASIKLWQRSYHDHIIHNQQDYQKIWKYIHSNPLQWEEDCFYSIH